MYHLIDSENTISSKSFTFASSVSISLSYVFLIILDTEQAKHLE